MEQMLSSSLYYHLTETGFLYVESNRHWMAVNQLLSNAELVDGFVRSVSSYSDIASGVGTSYSLSSLFNGNKQKEDVWERIREVEFSSLPSRKNALFLFDEINLACEANRKWFACSRDLVRVRLVEGYTVVHKADSRWLDTFENQWESAARNYWKGIMTMDNPFPEIVAEGMVYIDLRKGNGEDSI